MPPRIQNSIAVLEKFRENHDVHPDRDAIIAHATLHAWQSHWPSQASAAIQSLLNSTSTIREKEPGRWIVQRRIALAKLAQALATSTDKEISATTRATGESLE